MKKQGNITKKDVPQLVQFHLPEYKANLIKIKPTFGMTNETYKVSAEGLENIIFRILSPVIDRKYQNKVLVLLNENKICPKLLYTCQSYRMEQFIDNAQHPTTQKINQDTGLLQNILKRLYELHQIKLSGELTKSFFNDIVFCEKNRQKCKHSKCTQKGKEKLFEELKSNLLQEFDQLKDSLKKKFPKGKHPTRLCHNDMNNNNIFIKKNNKNEIIFIDFQYACLNYVAYDLANFLNECCFDYFDEAPGFKIYKKVTQEEIKKVCSLYPGKYEGIEEDVKQMLKLSNFWWAIWSLQVKATRNVQKFSPTQHCKSRWQLYQYYAKQFYK